jgi:hypothetical protein
MRHLLILAVLCCLAACKTNPPPPAPPPGGVNIRAPGVDIRTGGPGTAVHVEDPDKLLPPPVFPAR